MQNHLLAELYEQWLREVTAQVYEDAAFAAEEKALCEAYVAIAPDPDV